MAYSANLIQAKQKVELLDFDPDSGSETIATLNPAASEKGLALAALGGLVSILAVLFHSVGTGTVTSFRIFVSDDAAGATNATNVVSHAIGSIPDAVGDFLVLEATAEQLRTASTTALYVGVKVTLGTSTDECVIGLVRKNKQAYGGLTADYVS